MKRSLKPISMLVLLLSLCLAGFAQQSGGVAGDEASIKQHRDEIQKLAAKTPPPETKTAHDQTLAQLRRELRDLLLQKKGAVRKDIQDLQSPNASTSYQNYLKQLGELLRSVEDEITGLDGDLSASGGVAMAPPAAVPSPQPSPAQPTQKQLAVEAAFKANVDSLAGTDLKKAAAPAAVMSDVTAPLSCKLIADPNTVDQLSRYQQNVCRLAHNILERKNNPNLPAIYLQVDESSLLPILIVKLLKTQGEASFVSFLSDAEQARTDKQVGNGPGNSGTTSLISKGGVPWAFGWAVENGAATESTNGTSITFRVNPVGAIKVLSNKGFLTGFREAENDPALNFLRRSSFGITYDTSRGDQPGTFTGRKQQLSSFSLRYEFVNERDPRNKRYQGDWEAFVAKEGVAFAQKMWAVTMATEQVSGRMMRFKDPALEAWVEKASEVIRRSDATTMDDLVLVLNQQIDLLPVKDISEDTTRSITDFAKGLEAYTIEKKKLLDKIAKGRLITFEYVNHREVNAPDTSNFNFIAEGGTGRRIDFTANASLTMFNKKPVGLNISRIRDFQFAGQVDIPLGNVMGFGQPVFSFTGRYERLVENASTAAGTIMPNTKGDIAFGQVKLTIPIKNTGFSLPISMTFSNRTELIKEKDVRGNFGLTFDLDKILAKFKPF